MKLIEVEIGKYKCFQKTQKVEIDKKITAIVGMNESGKTTFLSALGKTNYFDENDKDFKFDTTQDYPRTELIDFEANSTDKGHIISCTYEIDVDLLKKINSDLEVDVFSVDKFTVNYNYRGNDTVSGVIANDRKFIEYLSSKYQLSDTTKTLLSTSKSIGDAIKLVKAEGDVDFDKFQQQLKKYAFNPDGLNDLGHYIYSIYLEKAMPKFWYFDDYYPLSGKIDIQHMKDNSANTEQDKTAKALFELARIRPDDILSSTSEHYERFIALLEASANKITKEIFNNPS